MYMRRSLQYKLERELEMVWVHHETTVAMGCMLWLHWFCKTECPVQHMIPPNDIDGAVVCDASARRQDAWSCEDR